MSALTDKEWREFQSIPEQGYSHRHWVDARIAERVAASKAAAWDQCLDEIEKYELNTEQAREGNPYRAHANGEGNA